MIAREAGQEARAVLADVPLPTDELAGGFELARRAGRAGREIDRHGPALVALGGRRGQGRAWRTGRPGRTTWWCSSPDGREVEDAALVS